MRVDVEKLTEKLMGAMPNSTILALGTRDLDVRDIIDLPRLSDHVLRLPGNYIYITELEEKLKAYIGSANGQFGVLGRWKSYNDDVKRARPTSYPFQNELRQKKTVCHLRSLWNAPHKKINVFYIAYESISQIFFKAVDVPATFACKLLNATIIKSWITNVTNRFISGFNPTLPRAFLPGYNQL